MCLSSCKNSVTTNLILYINTTSSLTLCWLNFKKLLLQNCTTQNESNCTIYKHINILVTAIVSTMGKVSYEDKLCIQMLHESARHPDQFCLLTIQLEPVGWHPAADICETVFKSCGSERHFVTITMLTVLRITAWRWLAVYRGHCYALFKMISSGVNLSSNIR